MNPIFMTAGVAGLEALALTVIPEDFHAQGLFTFITILSY
jgi:hypothetical protein